MEQAYTSWDRLEEKAEALRSAVEDYFSEQFDYQYRVRGDNGLGISKETAIREAREWTEKVCNGGIQRVYVDIARSTNI